MKQFLKFLKYSLFAFGFLSLLTGCQTVAKQIAKQIPQESSGLSVNKKPLNKDTANMDLTQTPGAVDEELPTSDMTNKPGWVSVFQTFTSDKETSINILRPRFAPLAYYVKEDQGPLNWKSGIKQEVLKTTSGPLIHWKVDRIHAKDLDPGKSYRLIIVNRKFNKIIDWRRFKTLDLDKKKVRFIIGSCLSDSHAFEHIRNRIWDQLLTHKADFLILLGDQVYVDDFDFVKRKEAKEFDLWTRYIDSFRKIPIFQNRELIPIMAVWDDHDYGSNNSDRNFPSKTASLKVFSSFFGGESIEGIYETAKDQGNKGVYFSFKGFGQKFLLMDDRYFRESNKKSPYGQWGKKQYNWFQKQIKESKSPLWIGNGGQFFVKAKFVPRRKGSKKQINESFIDDQPVHFKKLTEDIKKASQPVIFLSGDSHHSEISLIEKGRLGYETYEITSSPIHSFIYRDKKPSIKAQDPKPRVKLKTTGTATATKSKNTQNPEPLVRVKEYNYIVIDSQVSEKSVNLEVSSMGVKQKEPFFKKKLKVSSKNP